MVQLGSKRGKEMENFGQVRRLNVCSYRDADSDLKSLM